ncbi:unnamed protein product, partial [Ceratitis capitata]
NINVHVTLNVSVVFSKKMSSMSMELQKHTNFRMDARMNGYFRLELESKYE